jgi:hemerythrin
LIQIKEVAMVQRSVWNAELARGVATVDSEHRLQTRLVAVLRQAAEARRDPSVIEEILRRVADTSSSHFQGEELLMRLGAYDHYGVHVEEHRRLLEQLDAMRDRFQAEPGYDLLGAIGAIEEWLGAHIMGMDRRFIESVDGAAAAPN